jgi:hypothetical protein
MKIIFLTPGNGAGALTVIFALLLQLSSFKSQAQGFRYAHAIKGSNVVSEGVCRDASGNTYLLGNFAGQLRPNPSGAPFLLGSNGTDLFLAKYSASGKYIWTFKLNTLTPYGAVYAKDIVADAAGNIFITGNATSDVDLDPSSGTDTTRINKAINFVAKYDTAGNYLWGIKIPHNGSSIINSISIDREGNIYTSGAIYDNVNFNPLGTALLKGRSSFSQSYVAKYNGDGMCQWVNLVHSNTTNIFPVSVSADESGEYVFFSGHFSGATTVVASPDINARTTVSSGNHSYIVKYNAATGEALWIKCSNITNNIIHSIKAGPDGNVVSLGLTPGNTRITSLDAAGDTIWSHLLPHVPGTSIRLNLTNKISAQMPEAMYTLQGISTE